jgi:hypothetical protein
VLPEREAFAVRSFVAGSIGTSPVLPGNLCKYRKAVQRAVPVVFAGTHCSTLGMG